ncbi:MAG TPA: phosphorylase [Candidatus Dormibacteraeota bacterium]|nr:phosphorylase [Candidatus Dormibacteraeota bacterium]
MVRATQQPAIPQVAYALLGGSGTGTQGSPELERSVRMLTRDVVFATPFGDSPPITHFELPLDSGGLRPVLFARPYAGLAGAMAARPSRERAQQALALFWVLRRAGVTRVVAESGAASITQHFHPRDLVVPHDFIDFTHQHGGQLEPSVILVMRDPFCPEIREALWQRARQFAADKATRAFNRAVHVTVEGPRLETAAEVAALARLGGDIISQSLTPEVYLAREVGACFGSVEMVLNYAEGVRPEWDFELLRAIVREGAEELGRVALDALLALPDEPQCGCGSHRLAIPTITEVVAESA